MRMPNELADLLVLLLRRAGLEPAHRAAEALGYDLHYESGLLLKALIVAREEGGWFRSHGYLDLWILNAALPYPVKEPLMTETMPFPRVMNDLVYGMMLLAKLLAMAQASADMLGGGNSLSYRMLASVFRHSASE